MINRWTFFSEDEMRCKGTGELHMNEDFMKKLIALRREFNSPMIITSGYRRSDYNKQVGGKKKSAHIHGKAVDVRCYGEKAFKLVQLAFKYKFTGIGIKQNGPHKERFIHLDTINEETYPRPSIWSYK
jgi:zinc D-Ala-D-Ala carboxypeptidase